MISPVASVSAYWTKKYVTAALRAQTRMCMTMIAQMILFITTKATRMLSVLQAIWQADGTFPSGSFAFSYGVEALWPCVPNWTELRLLS